ncbi:hypothetical protein D9613_011367 [Agrocybe pediades]|uniref:DUF6533 domain-containing protein n=1 Tax=Agrocybe pediades TaxID=84607 RepID=A0A8H4QRI7_9AGAR|nr:hypothetical protein D9613_011367 [Agrocybe pediades]
MSSIPTLPPLPSPNALAEAVRHLQAGKYFQIAAYVMMIYDHMLTFPEEVERIWKARFSGATVLFLINRYITPLQFLIIIDAFEDPSWTKAPLSARLDISGLNFLPAAAIDLLHSREHQPSVLLPTSHEYLDTIMILRVYALYGRNLYILAFLLVLWVVQIVLSSIGINTGFAVPLPPGLVGCIFSGSNPLFPAIWVTPLLTDTCIFILTMWRTRGYLTSRSRTFRTPTLELFMRDGLMYFLVIFSANLLNMLLFFLAPQDLKAIGASFSQMLTATMISRLVLNLRSVSSSEISRSPQYMSSFVARTVIQLGEEMDLNSTTYGSDDIPLKDFTSSYTR